MVEVIKNDYWQILGFIIYKDKIFINNFGGEEDFHYYKNLFYGLFSFESIYIYDIILTVIQNYP